MVNEQYFGRACKTCRRRGRGCDRRMPACNTCETSGQTCEGYLLQWPGLASRGQFVGKSIPVPGAKKRRRSRRVQRSVASSPSPPTVPPSPRSPVNVTDNVEPEIQESQIEELLDTSRLFVEVAETHDTLPVDEIWPGDFSPINFLDEIPEAQDLGADSPLQDLCKDLGGSLGLYNMLNPSFGGLSLPDELKFIMQYR